MTEKRKSGTALKIILPLLILLIGVGGFMALNKMRKTPQRHTPPQLGILVEVLKLEPAAHQIKVHATGTVTAEQEISLVPEVSGKVVWLAPQLVSGGFFKAGEPFLQIEASDYQLAIEKARAEIARAEVALRTELERAEVAKQEWDRIDLPDKGSPGPLVTREIQVLQEQANLAAAKANLKQAELNLLRTVIKAPFDGRVRQEMVDLGQYLKAGTSIGSFAGTARAEIHVPLPLAELRWLKIPSAPGTGGGSTALINLPGNSDSQWQGQIVRSLGEIDATSRMASVVIAVDDPYHLNGSADSPVLQTGQFVELQLLGEKLEQVFSIPRDALRTGEQIWIADQENRLHLRPVKVLRREQQRLLLESGVNTGERLVLTNISGAAEGLLLRPVLQEQPR